MVQTNNSQKKELRKLRAAMHKEQRALRTDLDQLIYICTNSERGPSTREKSRLIARIRDRYRDDPQAMQAVKSELGKHKIEI